MVSTPISKSLPFIADAVSRPLVASNPLEALVPEDKLRSLKALPEAQRHQYMGRMVDGIFKDPSYQAAVGRVAEREFGALGSETRAGGDLSSVIEQAVEQALRARGL